MTFYIAQFTARHKIVQIEQHSVFIWKQEGGDIDSEMLEEKIKRESASHFFRMVAGESYPIATDDLYVAVHKTMPYGG